MSDVRLSSVDTHCTSLMMSALASSEARRASLATVCTAVRVIAIASRRLLAIGSPPLSPTPIRDFAICAFVRPSETPFLMVRSMSKRVLSFSRENQSPIVAPWISALLAMLSIAEAGGRAASMPTAPKASRKNPASAVLSSVRSGGLIEMTAFNSAIALSSRLP